jgi:hypothetical protein
VCEEKEDRVPYSEQPGYTNTVSEEQDSVLSLEGSFDDHVQVHVTMKAAKHSSETPSILAHLVLTQQPTQWYTRKIARRYWKNGET